jgi:hypothetical protein
LHKMNDIKINARYLLVNRLPHFCRFLAKKQAFLTENCPFSARKMPPWMRYKPGSLFPAAISATHEFRDSL